MKRVKRQKFKLLPSLKHKDVPLMQEEDFYYNISVPCFSWMYWEWYFMNPFQKHVEYEKGDEKLFE